MAPASVLVVRVGAMGDILHTLPAVAGLRRAFPQADIGWTVEERWRELLCAEGTPLAGPLHPSRPLVNAVHVVNTRGWRLAPFSDETWREILAVRRQMRQVRYEIAVDWQGALKSAVLARMSGAASVAGFREPREPAARIFYTRTVEARGLHIIEQNIELARALGAQSDFSYQLPYDATAEAWCQAELARRQLREFAIITPGGGWGAKLWPAARYAEVARALAAEGLRSLINYSPAEEKLARELEEHSGGAAEAIACSVGQLVALTRRARLFLGGDTGPMHLAAALNVPLVALFGPTDPRRNGPYLRSAIVIRHPASVTSYSHRAEADAGLLRISPPQVMAAAHQLLSGSAG